MKRLDSKVDCRADCFQLLRIPIQFEQPDGVNRRNAKPPRHFLHELLHRIFQLAEVRKQGDAPVEVSLAGCCELQRAVLPIDQLDSETLLKLRNCLTHRGLRDLVDVSRP